MSDEKSRGFHCGSCDWLGYAPLYRFIDEGQLAAYKTSGSASSSSTSTPTSSRAAPSGSMSTSIPKPPAAGGLRAIGAQLRRRFLDARDRAAGLPASQLVRRRGRLLSLNRSTSSVLSSTPSPGVVGAAIHPSAIFGIAGLTSSRRRIEVMVESAEFDELHLHTRHLHVNVGAVRDRRCIAEHQHRPGELTSLECV